MADHPVEEPAAAKSRPSTSLASCFCAAFWKSLPGPHSGVPILAPDATSRVSTTKMARFARTEGDAVGFLP